MDTPVPSINHQPSTLTTQPPASFAYLFERFPSFTQTFCFREVEEMVRQGMAARHLLHPRSR